MRTGLFLVRRERTWITRRISSSRPMTGSSLPLRASAVRSRPYFSSAWYCSSGFWLVTRWLPRTSRSAVRSSSRLTPSFSASARRRCSVERYSSPISVRALSALSMTACRSRPRRGSVPPYALVSFETASSAALRSASGALPTLLRIGRTTPSSWRSNAASRWSGVTSGLLFALADSTALVNASCVFSVQRFGSSGGIVPLIILDTGNLTTAMSSSELPSVLRVPRAGAGRLRSSAGRGRAAPSRPGAACRPSR